MFTPAQILAANHPADGAHGHLKREVLLREEYHIGLRQWQRICTGQFEINPALAHALLDRFARCHPHAAYVPCIVQELPGGDWLIRVRKEDTHQIERLLRAPVPERLAA